VYKKRSAARAIGAGGSLHWHIYTSSNYGEY